MFSSSPSPLCSSAHCPVPLLSFRAQRGICFSLLRELCVLRVLCVNFFFLSGLCVTRRSQRLRVSFSALGFLYLITSLLLYFINSTKTSFDMLNLSEASRTTLPSRSTRPADASGSNRAITPTPYSPPILATSIPSTSRNPQNTSPSTPPSTLILS